MCEETIEVLLAEYKELVEDQKLLNALIAAGVDNWSGYSFALEEMESE